MANKRMVPGDKSAKRITYPQVDLLKASPALQIKANKAKRSVVQLQRGYDIRPSYASQCSQLFMKFSGFTSRSEIAIDIGSEPLSLPVADPFSAHNEADESIQKPLCEFKDRQLTRLGRAL